MWKYAEFQNNLFLFKKKNTLQQCISNFVIGDDSFRSHDTAIRSAISKIITDVESEEMFLVPGGAVCMSGYGDGCYPVFAKRVNGKVVCAFTAFI